MRNAHVTVTVTSRMVHPDGKTSEWKHKTKVALGCGVCAYADEELSGPRARCVTCLKEGRSKFVLDKQYAGRAQGEHDVEADSEYNEHATI